MHAFDHKISLIPQMCTMCTMVLKETLAYYTVDGGSAFCTFLDATKAFDRDNYCKLFSVFIKSNQIIYFGQLGP